jgi:hypothetical protein
VLSIAVLTVSWAAPVSALPGPVGKITDRAPGKLTDPLPDVAPDAAPNPVQGARKVVGGAAGHARNAASEVQRAATQVENAAGNVLNGARDAVTNTGSQLGGAADEPQDAPPQQTNEPRDPPAATTAAPARTDAEATEQGRLLAAGNGDAVGGGNDVRPSPGTGAPPPDGLCQSSPVCLGILFADDRAAPSGAGGPSLSLPFTGLDPLVGLLVAALLGLGGILLLAPDFPWCRGGTPLASLVWVAHAAPARSRGSRGL